MSCVWCLSGATIRINDVRSLDVEKGPLAVRTCLRTSGLRKKVECPTPPRFISQLIEVVPSLWNPPPLSIASGGGSLLKRISDETGSSPVPASRAPAFPPLPHRLRDFRRVPPAAVEGVERRARRPRPGEGRALPPLPRAPSQPRAGRPDRPGSPVPAEARRLPGAHARGPCSRRAWPLRAGRVKARHAASPQIASRGSAIGGDGAASCVGGSAKRP